MTTEQWMILGNFGQVASAIFTFLGVLVSLYMSFRALKEVHIDRKLNRAPYLAFVPGGQRLPIDFEMLSKDEQIEEKVDKIENPTWIGIKTENGIVTHKYHGLKNYGLGPAIQARVTWIPEQIWAGAKNFLITKDELLERKYSKVLNTIPASPGHILPGQEASFFRIPTFIVRDFEKIINRVSGIIEIRYMDLFKEEHLTRQKFHIFTGYKGTQSYIHFTFSDIQFEE